VQGCGGALSGTLGAICMRAGRGRFIRVSSIVLFVLLVAGILMCSESLYKASSWPDALCWYKASPCSFECAASSCPSCWSEASFRSKASFCNQASLCASLSIIMCIIKHHYVLKHHYLMVGCRVAAALSPDPWVRFLTISVKGPSNSTLGLPSISPQLNPTLETLPLP